MERLAAVSIDHVTVYCKKIGTLNQVMDALGFYAKDGTHYMFRNNYLEGYEVKPSDPPYAFFTSEAALHSFIFWSGNIDESRRRLEDAGYTFAFPITETVFSWPGMGRLLVNGIQQKNVPMVIGCTIIFSVCFSVINLIVDILYAIIDPRIKSQYATKKKEKST